MDRNDPSYEGQRGYNRILPAIYDPWVLGFMTRAVWRCPIPPVVERYRRLLGRRHLDVGPGAGDFDDLEDTAEGLRRILDESFETVDVEVVGSTANFTARGPRRPSTTSSLA
jgi:hypothetical protein